jgi:hypothetical protein
MALTKEEIAKLDAAGLGGETQEVEQPQGKSLSERLGLSSTPTFERDATFKATGEEGLISGVAKAVGNIPKSGLELGKSVVEAFAHPIKTTKAIAETVKGAGSKVGEKILEDTDFGQKLLQKAKDSGIDIKSDETGKLQVKDTPELEKFNTLIDYFGSRYGSVDDFKKTIIEDPVGTMADIASIVSLGGGTISKVGEISKIEKLSKAGQTISELGKTAEPVQAITKTAKETADIIGKIKDTSVGKVISDITPTASKIQKNEVVKALDLTPGDLSNIQKATGNDVTEFIIKNNAIKNTPEEVAQAMKDIRTTTMKNVRDEISNVKKIYKAEEIPTVKKGLDVIYQGVNEISGLETIASEIKNLAEKTDFTLSDIQRAKELIDENSNIYSKIGDVKSSAQARGLDNIRKDIRKFIEDEVDTATNGQTDIRKLNNDVQTSYEIEDAINKRATKGMTRQAVSVFDMILGTGGVSALGPLGGTALVLAKKVAENPTVRLKVAELLNKKPIEFINKVIKETTNKTLSQDTIKQLKEIIDIAKNQYVESGSKAISDIEQNQ